MRRLFFCALVVAAGLPAYSQSSPLKIAGVLEPLEFSGQPKQVKKQTETQKQLAAMVGELSDKTKAKAARPTLNKFLEEHPGYSDAFLMRAVCDLCTLQIRDYPSILKDIEASISTYSSSTDESFHDKLTNHYLLRGKLKSLLGQHRDAIDDLERAMKVNIESAEHIFEGGAIEPEEESTPCDWNLTDLNMLVAKFPKDYRTLLFRGLKFLSRSQDASAEREFQKAAVLNPKSPLPHYFIGAIYEKASLWRKFAGSPDEGWKERKQVLAYNTAIQLDPKFRSAYAMRANAYYNLKQYAQAIRDYDKVLELDPENTSAYADRGLAKLELGQYIAATLDLGNSIRRRKADDGTLTRSYWYRADAYTKAGMYGDAIEDYSNAIKQHLTSLIFLLNLKQIRGLYPEYNGVSDEALCRKIHGLLWPEFEYAVFAKQLLGWEDEDKWASSTLSDLYERRGDAYLRANDFRRGVLDFIRIFKGLPKFADTVERWRKLGFASGGEQHYVDVKSMEVDSNGAARLWVKTLSKKLPKATYTVQAYEVDCKGRRLNLVSFVLYDSSDHVVSSSDVPTGWRPIVPDSMGERLYNGMCSQN
jgi:tetratricopeptide (TPR) repeat protein